MDKIKKKENNEFHANLILFFIYFLLDLGFFFVKSDWYVKIHKVKDDLRFEKNIIDLIINSKLDDSKSFLPEEDIKKLDKFESDFWKGYYEKCQEITNIFEKIQFHIFFCMILTLLKKIIYFY